jgi:hypothetical protein
MSLSKVPNQPRLTHLPGATQDKGFSFRIFDPLIEKSGYSSIHNPSPSFPAVFLNENNMKNYDCFVNNNALFFTQP